MSPARRATLLLFGTTILWGSSFFTMMWGMEGVARRLGASAAPHGFLFLRFALSLLVQGVVFHRAMAVLTKRIVVAGVILSIPFYAGFVLQVMGLGHTTSTISAFLTSLFVVITPLLGRLLFREKLAASTLAGAAVSLAGVWVMTDPAGGLGRGEILTLLCAVAFAFQIQMTNVITRDHPPEAITFVQFACATLYSGITVGAMGAPPMELLRSLGEKHVAWTVAWTAIACSVIAMGVLNRFQRDIPATRASVLYMMEPVFAAILAVLFTGEAMTGRKILGGAVILGGNLLCEVIGRRAGEKNAA